MYRNNDDAIDATHPRTVTAIIGACAIGLLLWVALPGPAKAGGTADTAPSVRISVRQGDLDNPFAARLLFDRIQEAAMEVCGASPFSFSDVRRAVRQSDCWRQAVSAAVAELHDPDLTARLAQRIDMDRGPIARQD